MKQGERSLFCTSFYPDLNVVLTILGFIRGCAERKQEKIEINKIIPSPENTSQIWAFTTLLVKSAGLVLCDLTNPWQYSFSLQLNWAEKAKGGQEMNPLNWDTNFHAQLTLLTPIKLTVTYEVCPEGIQPCDMKNRDIYWRRCKIQETLYIRQWCPNPLQSRHLGTSHSSSNHH